MPTGDNPKSKEAGKKNLRPPKTSEEAKERGRMGGIKSGEVKKAKRTLKETIKLLMEMPAVGATKASLKNIGLSDEEQTNMAAYVTKIYLMALNGDLKACELLAQLGGLSQEEVRKDNEEKRKAEESRARISAINANLGKEISVSSGDDEGDVVIYLPEVEKDEEDDE